MLRWFRADLHIHTCLSPCADLTMSPRRLTDRAHELGIEILGVCDHNSAENLSAVMTAAERHGITVLPGIEITSREEVHVLTLFDNLDAVHRMQDEIYRHLGEDPIDPRIAGEQIIVNAQEEVEGFNSRPLISACDLSIEEIVHQAHRLSGLAVAAHVDRPGYSIIGKLGFIPENIGFDALEISRNTSLEHARKIMPEITEYALYQASDAHYLRDIGKATTSFQIATPGIEEIRLAWRNLQGRKYRPGAPPDA